MATSAFGRALLAILMAQILRQPVCLVPVGAGLARAVSKADSVGPGRRRARLVPARMTLVTANARLSLFGLVAMLIGGGLNGSSSS
jgi:hypothetical protein